MLPSIGYFKGLNCPFYDSGLCERPYCHFRHVKKESQNTSNDAMESGVVLQKLVSAAVQKVLQQKEGTSGIIEPTTYANLESGTETTSVSNSQSSIKVTYNPTPISELNKIINAEDNASVLATQAKRHIPVPYTPRKPASLLIKRPPEIIDEPKLIYLPPPVKYTPGSSDKVELDPYTPKGSIESDTKYLPGSETELQKYTPIETNSSNKLNYVPSDKNKKKKLLEYKPVKVNKQIPSIKYEPTPRSLAPCFSSDEEEPENKKQKLSNDFNSLDLDTEFNMLDEILVEEKSDIVPSEKTANDKICKKITESSDIKESNVINSNSIKDIKNDNTNSNKDVKSDKKREMDTSKNSKHDSKSKSSDKKSKHKDKDKEKDKNNKKYSEKSRDKHSSSSSRKSENSKHGKEISSKNDHSKSESKHSKHSSSSKHDSKKDSKHSEKSRDQNKDIKKKKEDSHSKHKIKKDVKSKKSNGKVSHSDSSHKENNIDNTDFDNETLDEAISESDEESIAMECKRIFEEYVPTPKSVQAVHVEESEDNIVEEYIPGKKRISRTAEKNIKIIPRAPMKPDYKVSASQTMAERLAKVREFHSSRISSASTIAPENCTFKTDTTKNIVNSTPNTGSSKVRIAHVPYASTLLNAKKTITTPSVEKTVPPTSSTVIQTIKKGLSRVAHMPNEKFIDRPGVLEPLASKIPANIRSTYLNMMIDECLKIYILPVDAYARAQHEELVTSKKCSTVQIYKNSAVLAVSRLRKELQECNGVKKSGSDCTTLQQIPKPIIGQAGSSGSWSIESKSRRVSYNSKDFSGPKFYKNIEKWILTEQQLQDNGFPRPHPGGEKGRAMIYVQNTKQRPPKGFIRTCCRCKKDYTVDKKGFPSIKEECIYHPNNKYKVRGEAKYQCCSQDGSSDGCCIAPNHVYEYVDYENLRGYVRTLPPETLRDDYGIYSLDCEMCYTSHGLDLTRITVINSECKTVYETLIKPLHPIIDYNTRYSGITEEQMSDVKTTILEVQATLLSMFNNKTILIGHSLESDFKALKIIHDTVIDTSVLFPHKMGPPYKRALRNLSSEFLKKIIQNSVDGHDSAEDATVCMELIHYKLKEDLKTR